jgi:thymidylate kinase
MTISFETPSTLDQVQPEGTVHPTNYVVLPIVEELCHTLRAENVDYCHWKSNNMLARSANGDNDLDLLINRADGTRFAEILFRLGFKQVTAPVEKQMPGVLDYFGFDQQAEKWVHVHAHYQLIMGHDMTKNFRLAIERPYLESAVQGELFRVPAVEFEFIILVTRMVLKHSTWDAILGREGKLSGSERKEVIYLQDRIDHERVTAILREHLPYIGVDFFKQCVEALQPGCSLWTRAKTGQKLQIRLRANAVYSIPIDTFLKLSRRMALMVQRRLFKPSTKYQLAIGGGIIAILGGDGAGKTTAVEALSAWLSKNFKTTKVHMGKPAWSWITIIVRFILKIGQILGLYPLEASFDETVKQKSLVSPGYPYLIREVCRARDRYWMYVKARRLAAQGALVILDRYPLPQIQIMDGAQSEQFVRQLQDGPRANQFLSPRLDHWFARFLVKLEESYYHQILLPELLMVLRLNPDIAVQRKTDEDSLSVHKRSTEIWKLNWENTDVHVIDASKSKTEVASEIKSLIWSQL